MEMRKMFALVLALIISLSCAIPANAAEWNPNDVDSSIAEQIEENNKRVEELWQAKGISYQALINLYNRRQLQV